ncbi:MAG: hypothetical protein M0R05_02710 [Bacilli bacterium]|nr:hypothetical protein [Bacilli bacterium]MDD4077525.1 hypothetical protein [Bacilli bacterium]MDD4387900.1 hypothetical protein [Bacilli bacterium]
MRFPKEKALIINKMNDYKKASDYYSIAQMKNQILDNYQECDTEIYEDLIRATFAIGNYDETILIGNDLITKNVETFTVIYYSLLAALGNDDIYQAKSLIKKSRLLSSGEIKNLYEKDGANYSYLLAYSHSLTSITLALIVVNFVEGLIREMASGVVIDHEYLLFRFFDLINMLYEIGYPPEIIRELSKVMKIIFNIDI